MAPTGIASKRMSESTDRDANTIHSVIGKLERSNDEDPFIPTDCPTCVVIDETSMVNVQTLDKMLSNLPHHVSILFSGDVDQLPSIGHGEILRDLIRSGVFPVTRLTKVFRQTDGSGIIDAAKAINKGEFPLEGDDFRILRISDPEKIADAIVQQCRTLLEEGAFDLKKDLMVLSPVKKGPAGVVALNERLQALLNPPAPHKTELIMSRPVEEDTSTAKTAEEKKKAREEVRDYKETLRVGDRVIQTKNDTNRAMVNGDIGYITRISPQTQTVWIDFDGVEKMISREQVSDPSNNCHLAETPY
jgi:exodeoxyribonuclease V alpha subunit